MLPRAASPLGARLGGGMVLQGCGASHRLLLIRNRGEETAAAVMPARSAEASARGPHTPSINAWPTGAWFAGSLLAQWPPASVGGPYVARTAASVAKSDGRRGFANNGVKGKDANGTGGKSEEARALILSQSVPTMSLVLKAPAENGEAERDVVMPEQMSTQLHPHQRVGVQFVWQRCVRESRGAILAHCMGLGKTFQMLAALQCVWQQSLALDEKWKMLVLAPVNVIRNWEAEYQKFMPGSDRPPLFKMVEAGSSHEDRVNYLEDWNKEGGIMLMGYDQFRNLAAGKYIRTEGEKFAKNIGIKERYQKALLDPGPYMVVCDEGHILRNKKSEVSKMVKKIKTKRRIVLSGTPMQNNLLEYHCMVDFVRPGLLGDAAAFKEYFLIPIQEGQCVDSTAAEVKKMRGLSFILHDKLKDVVDRADFKVLQPFLRPKHEFIIGIRLSELQAELYRSILETSPGGKGKVLRVYQNLVKVWSHPRILVDGKDRPRKALKNEKSETSDVEESEDEFVEGDWLKKYGEQIENLDADSTGKMLFLSKLLKEASVVGDKVLVFSQSLLLLDLIEQMLALAKQKGNGVINSDGVDCRWQIGVDYFRLDGSTSGDKRRDDMDKFNKSSKARLYLISTKAGSLGVNLAAANRVVLMDASWNPSYDQQAIFRAYRLGQEKECFIYRLLAHGTMEQKIYGRQVTKQALSSRVVDSEETGRHFSAEELRSLFEFTPGPTAEQVAAEQQAPASTNKEQSLIERTGDAESAAAVSENKAGPKAQKPQGNSNLFAATRLPPKDAVLARVLGELMPEWVVGYHEADSLNEVEKELTKEEIAEAWEEYKEKDLQPLMNDLQPLIDFGIDVQPVTDLKMDVQRLMKDLQPLID